MRDLVLRVAEKAMAEGMPKLASMRLAEEALQKLGVNTQRLQMAEAAVLSNNPSLTAVIGRTEKGAFLHVPNNATLYDEPFSGLKVLTADGAKLDVGYKSFSMHLPDGTRIASKDGIAITTELTNGARITQVPAFKSKSMAERLYVPGMYLTTKPEAFADQALLAKGGGRSLVQIQSDMTRIHQTSYDFRISRNNSARVIDRREHADLAVSAYFPGRMHLTVRDPGSPFATADAGKLIMHVPEPNALGRSVAPDEYIRISNHSLDTVFGRMGA